MFDNVRGRTPRQSRLAMLLVVLGVAVVLGSAVRALRRSTTEKTENTPALSAPAASDSAQPPMQTGSMVRIEGGKFRIGSDGGDRDEQPLQERTIRPFEIDVLEVATGEFEGCVAAGKCSPATRAEGNCNAGKPERRHHPVNCVDQAQAAEARVLSAAGQGVSTGELQADYAAWRSAVQGLVRAGQFESAEVKSFASKTQQVALLQKNLPAAALLLQNALFEPVGARGIAATFLFPLRSGGSFLLPAGGLAPFVSAVLEDLP